MFRESSLLIVLAASHLDRIRGVDGCANFASEASEEECSVALDKRAQVKDTWPGVGALVHGMEDEFPAVRFGAIKAIGAIAEAHPSLRDQCMKVVLEGLQDSSREVRLRSAKVARQCKPKQLQAPEVRLLLETLTSDDSLEVKETILEFLLNGPSFAETTHAAVAAEWLASLPTSSDSFLFQFGIRHSSTLYHAISSLENSRLSSHRGIRIVLAGVFSIYDISTPLKGAVNSQHCQQIKEEFERRTELCMQVEERLNDALVKRSTGQPIEFSNVDEFVREFMSAATSSQAARLEMLRYWSGFNDQTMARLKQWAQSGVLGTGRIQLETFDDESWEDSLPPRKASFEISHQLEFAPSSAVPFGIARFRVLVRGKHISKDSGVYLNVTTHGIFICSQQLKWKEQTKRASSFESVIVACPFNADLPIENVKFTISLVPL